MALDKYKAIKGMTEPAMITAMVRNLLGEECTEESINTATLIRYPRFPWRRAPEPITLVHGWHADGMRMACG